MHGRDAHGSAERLTNDGIGNLFLFELRVVQNQWSLQEEGDQASSFKLRGSPSLSASSS